MASLEDIAADILGKIGEGVELLRDLRGASQEESERAVQADASSSGGSGGGSGGGRSGGGGAGSAFAKQALDLGVSLTDNQTAGTAGAIGLARSGITLAGGAAGFALGGPLGAAAGAAVGSAAGSALSNLTGLTATQRVENSAFANTRDITRRFAAAGGEVTPEMVRGLSQGFRETARRIEKADDVTAGYYKSAQGFQDAGASALGAEGGILKEISDYSKRQAEALERIAKGGG